MQHDGDGKVVASSVDHHSISGSQKMVFLNLCMQLRGYGFCHRLEGAGVSEVRLHSSLPSSFYTANK